MNDLAKKAGTKLSNDWLNEFAHALYTRDHRSMVKIGSFLVVNDRALPALECDEPKRAAVLRDGLAKFEAKLSRRGIDPAMVRRLALRHAHSLPA